MSWNCQWGYEKNYNLGKWQMKTLQIVHIKKGLNEIKCNLARTHVTHGANFFLILIFSNFDWFSPYSNAHVILPFGPHI
jgi:hypothetical protein